MSKGHICLVLHAHLPFVRETVYKDYLEEQWFFEAVSETYLPLIKVFHNLKEDEVPFNITFSISPTLITMLGDELLQDKYVAYLEKMIRLTELEIARVKGNSKLTKLAKMYNKLYVSNLDSFVNVFKKNLLKPIRDYAVSGNIELITTAATHPHLPIYETFPYVVDAQIKTALELFIDTFGFLPKGFWLPDCAYYPGLDKILKDNGIKYFFTSAHGLLLSPKKPKYGVYSSYKTPAGCNVFCRDISSTNDVWSAEKGYPSDKDYREFYRDIGFDLPLEDIKDFLPDGDSRVFTGIKYHSVTGKTDDKELYDIDKAKNRVKQHAANFIFNRNRQFSKLKESVDIDPVVVSPFDAELFGHWWFEGTMWIDELFRQAQKSDKFVFSNPTSYLKICENKQVVEPIFSSWGNKGFSDVWINGSNDWAYKYIFEAILKMRDLVKRYPNEKGLKKRVLDQAAREVLLMQASDWTFILYTGTDVGYAKKTLKEHFNNFNTIYDNLSNGAIATSWVIKLEKKNNIFPNLDYRIFK